METCIGYRMQLKINKKKHTEIVMEQANAELLAIR